MNTHHDLAFPRYSHAFNGELSLEAVQRSAPAVFAPCAHAHMSAAYTFIPTDRVLSALMRVGFVPVEARQMRPRLGSELHARHIVRLRRRFESVEMRDSVPELLFLNSHDGSSAYQLRVGIFRVVCTNGLVVSMGAFPALRVNHRGNVVDEVVAGALELSERFSAVAAQVERMEQRVLDDQEKLSFAEEALAIRYPTQPLTSIAPNELLAARRSEDLRGDLFAVLNVVQENLLRGGVRRRSATGRITHTRRITSIREDMRVNSGLWDLASRVLAA